MAPVEVLGNQATFVGLQRADKVPLQRGDSLLAEVEDFFYPFLNIVFAERGLARGNGFFDGARRFRFTDCKQRYFF